MAAILLAHLVQLRILQGGFHPIPIGLLEVDGGRRCARRNLLPLLRCRIGRGGSSRSGALVARRFLHCQRAGGGARKALAQEQWRQSARKTMEQGRRVEQMAGKKQMTAPFPYLPQDRSNRSRSDPNHALRMQSDRTRGKRGGQPSSATPPTTHVKRGAIITLAEKVGTYSQIKSKRHRLRSALHKWAHLRVTSHQSQHNARHACQKSQSK